MSDTGVYYIATGEQFVNEAEVSARSVRRAMPDIPIAIATDVDPEFEFEFDYIIDIPDPEYGFVDQIHNLHMSPFEKTLHLDTDIYIVSDVSELFDLLNQFDIAAAHNHDREARDLPGVPDSFPEYNTGVMAYKNSGDISDFFQDWKKNYINMTVGENTQNQPSFRQTLYESNLRIATLTPEYNCMVRYPSHIKNDVKIAHSRLLDIRTPGANKSVNVLNSVEKINKHKGHRLFTPNGDLGVSIVYGRIANDVPLYKKAFNSIQTDGLKYALKNGIPFVINRLRRQGD